VHIGVGSRSSGDSVQRLSHFGTSIGLLDQHELLGARATVARATATIAAAARRVGPGDRLVLSFSGHAVRDGGWTLHDGTLRHPDTATFLARVDPRARVLVVADTCYAATFAEVIGLIPAATVLLAACAAHQTTLDHPVSEFVTALIRYLPADHRPAELQRVLRAGAPDIECPAVIAMGDPPPRKPGTPGLVAGGTVVPTTSAAPTTTRYFADPIGSASAGGRRYIGP